MTPLERRDALRQGEPVDRLPITLFHPEFAAKLANMTYNESHRTPEKLAQREINIYRQLNIDEIAIMYLSLKTSNLLRIKKLDKIDQLDLNYYAFANDERQQINHQAAQIIQQEIGDEIPLTYGLSGPITLAKGLIPIETLLKGTRKKPERVHQLLRFTTDVLKNIVTACADLENLNYLIYDPVASGSLISAKTYQEFCLPYTQELVAHMKKYTDSVTLHVCGDTSNSLTLLAETGVDAISLDQKVDMALAKEIIGGQVCLMGNVDPVRYFLQGTPAEMREAVQSCFDQAADSPKGFVIRSGCGLPYDTPLENVQAFIDAARECSQQL